MSYQVEFEPEALTDLDRKPQHPQTIAFQNVRSRLIMRLPLLRKMHPTIHLNHQPQRRTEKINNEIIVHSQFLTIAFHPFLSYSAAFSTRPQFIYGTFSIHQNVCTG